MKKIISWILLAAMMLSLLAGCGQATDPTQPSEIPEIPAESVSGENNAADVIAYLDAIYRDHGSNTPGNFQRFGIVRIAGVPYEVVWTADIGEDLLKVVVNDDGTVTIDVNEECTQDTPYILTATCTDSNGNTESTSWDYVLPGVDFEGMKDIVDQAYALDKGAAMDGVYTLMGEIISVDSAWSDQYKNITVSIIVKDREDKPIQCYRLKGDGAQDLMIGDTITVYGNLKNYNGTIEFDAGCQLVAVIKGDGVVIEAPSDPLEIMKAAYDLKTGMSLPYEATLTGVITGIDTAYSTQYKNISVVMDVDGAPGYEILCYRLKGEEADTLNVNDIITVTGKIKNYAGTIEFDAGCQLSSVTQKAGPKMPNNEQCIVDSAYALAKGKSLPYTAILTGKVVSIDTPFSNQYRNISITIAVDQRENKPIICYRLSGTGAETLEVGDVVTVVGSIKHYYNTTTKESKIEFDQGCKIMDVWKSFSYGPLNEGSEYLMYVNQNNLGKKLYFNGGISEKNGKHYLTTTENQVDAAIFFVDKTNNGVLFYIMNGNSKVYINAVSTAKGVDIQLDTTPNSYFTYNTGVQAYTIQVDGEEYYLGTYGNYDTLSLSKISYISTSFPIQAVANDPTPDTELSIADVIALGQTKAHNTYTEGKYYVTGVISEVYNTQYGNMYLTDDAGNKLTIYGTYSADGSQRYDAMSVKPVAGDTVTIYGIVGQYNGTSQIKNGWITEHIPGEGSGQPEEPEVNTDPKPDTELSIAAAIALGASKDHNTYTSGKYYVTGVITEVYNTQYGNMYITDNAGNTLTIYGTYNEDGSVRYDGMENPPVAGDTVTIYGIIGQYGNKPQMKNGWIIPEKEDAPAAGSELTISKAISLGSSMAHNTYTADKYYVTGKITEVYNTTYGNMKITDDAGNILTIYGTYDADGTNRYDAMATKPVAGDTVTVYGVVGQYNSTPQIKNGWITEHIPAGGGTVDPEPPVDPEKPVDPEAGSTLSIADAIALGSSKAHDTYTSGKYYVTGKITEVYNTTYGNMRLTDDAGNILTVYGTYDANGTNRYDAMATKPVAGDTVTVYGIIGQYNGTAQIKNGWITEHIPAGGETDEPETPVEPDIPTLTASTLSFASKSNRVSQNEDQQVWAQNGITFTNNMAASINPVADYANPVRLYAGSDIIIAASGMKKIEIHVNANKGTSGLTGALNAAGISYTESGNVITIEFASAVNSLTITGLTAQVRFDAITVYA